MAALFVVATILLFLTVDWIVQRSRARKLARISIPVAPVSDQPYLARIPDGIFFAKSHTWINLSPSGNMRLGIDDFVASLLEKARITLVKSDGDHVRKGEPLLVISEEGSALAMNSPISGVITSTNERLEASRGLKRTEQFGEDWAYTIRPDGPDELRGLMLGEQSRSWMAEELRRLRDFLAAAVAHGEPAPAAMQDGGVPAPGALVHMGPETWRRFEQQFLQVP